MPDKKTTEETVRFPIDGTELVRLAVPGGNWKASLSDIFDALGGGGGGSGSPGGSNTTVQFNNSGAFGGTNNFRWDSTGLTIGGATQSGGVITPGTATHAAIGNYGVVDWWTASPGDPSNQYTPGGGVPTVLSINEKYISPTDTPNFQAGGIAVHMGFVNQSGEGASFVGYLADSSINSDNIDEIDDFVELELNPSNYNPQKTNRFAAILGNISNVASDAVKYMYCLNFGGTHVGTGTVREYYGTNVDCYVGSSAGNVTFLYGSRIALNVSGSNVDFVTGIMIESTDGFGEYQSYSLVARHNSYVGPVGGMVSTAGGSLFQGHVGVGSDSDVSDSYALFIDDHSRSNGGFCSAGATSNNLIEGYLGIKETGTPPSTVANTARIFAVDNGSGKTRLMVQFGSGAAVQIAIEP